MTKMYLVLDQDGENTTIVGTALTIEQAREIKATYEAKMGNSQYYVCDIIEMEAGRVYMDDQELEYVK